MDRHIANSLTAQLRASDMRTPLQRALCGAQLPMDATRMQVQQAYDLAVWDCAWQQVNRLRAVRALMGC